MRVFEFRNLLSGTVVSVHFVWEDTTPTVDEIEKGGPDQYAWV